MAFIVCNIELD